MKLDGLCGLVATQFGREAQGAVDAGRNTGGEDPGTVDDHPFVDWDRAEEWQQVKRRPVRRRPPPLEQAGRAAEQSAGARRENAARACRLLPDPAQHFSVFHQGFLADAARQVQDIQRRRIGQGRVRGKQ